ncbi:hypothetical protein FF38_07941 [Lucilia cuprina]|uniref:Uncharacterized protein n=1 Tax=Lucilia cuprina TaxID=7375 RepID=A0A0L0BSL5_LUCCU|nr:hypothetical protein FF38_07941 [Lucilia cuprina]
MERITAFRFNAKSSRSGSSIGDRTSVGNSTSPTPSFSSSEGGGGIYATIGGSHHFTHNFPPPTTAPPPPPTQHSHYQQQHYYQQQQQQLQHQQQQNSTAAATAAHRVSAPPSGSGIEAISDPNLLYEQHRRVKSINDIGATAASAYGSTSALARDRLSSGLNSGADSASICSGLSGTGAIIHENNHGASTASSNSPV